MRELSNRKILIITVGSPPFVRLKPDIMTKLNKTSFARHAINYWPTEENTGEKNVGEERARRLIMIVQTARTTFLHLRGKTVSLSSI